MDWVTWLLKTGLDPPLAYEYGYEFERNKLDIAEDLPYLDHDFLRSMGVTIAKHRLEILKLARKEVDKRMISRGGRSPGLSKLFASAIRRVRQWASKGDSWAAVKPVKGDEKVALAMARRSAARRREEIVRGNSVDKELVVVNKLPVIKTRRIAKSGPLMIQSGQRPTAAERRLKLSGPLEGAAVQERLISAYRSPVVSGPLEERQLALTCSHSLKLSGPLATPRPRVYDQREHRRDRLGDRGDEHPLWAALFRDMQPT